jgi:hypothetical protein
MIFKGIENQTLDMKVLGYQFPDKIPESENGSYDYDANWLRVYFIINSNLGNWHSVDPAFTTGELKDLIKWFDDLSKNNIYEIGFMEPCIDFTYLGEEEGFKKIRISFGAELKPISGQNTDQEYFIDCIYNNEELTVISKELSKELTKNPPR